MGAVCAGSCSFDNAVKPKYEQRNVESPLVKDETSAEKEEKPKKYKSKSASHVRDRSHTDTEFAIEKGDGSVNRKQRLRLKLRQDQFSEPRMEPMKLRHNFVNIPNISSYDITGNILYDINQMWNETIYLAPTEDGDDAYDNSMRRDIGVISVSNNNVKTTTFSQCIVNDENFDNTSQLSPTGMANSNNNDTKNGTFNHNNNNHNNNNNNETKHNNHSYNNSDMINKKNEICSFEEIIKYKLIKYESQWNATHEYLIGAHLIDRQWIKFNESRNILSIFKKSISINSMSSDPMMNFTLRTIKSSVETNFGTMSNDDKAEAEEDSLDDDDGLYGMTGSDAPDFFDTKPNNNNNNNNHNHNDNQNNNSKNGYNHNYSNSSTYTETGNNNNNNNNKMKVGFMVMQFNMLADCLSGAYWDKSNIRSKNGTNGNYNNNEDNKEDRYYDEKYGKCFYNTNDFCLSWKYRGLRLTEELLRYECDIICLQECDQSKFFYKNYLKHKGYKMVFQSKIDSKSKETKKLFLNLNNNNDYKLEYNKLRFACKDYLINKKKKKNGRSSFQGSNNKHRDRSMSTITSSKRFEVESVGPSNINNNTIAKMNNNNNNNSNNNNSDDDNDSINSGSNLNNYVFKPMQPLTPLLALSESTNFELPKLMASQTEIKTLKEEMNTVESSEVTQLLNAWDLPNDGICIFFKNDRFELASKKIQKFTKMNEIEAWIDFCDGTIAHSKLLPWTMVNISTNTSQTYNFNGNNTHNNNSKNNNDSNDNNNNNNNNSNDDNIAIDPIYDSIDDININYSDIDAIAFETETMIQNYNNMTRHLSIQCSVYMDYIDSSSDETKINYENGNMLQNNIKKLEINGNNNKTNNNNNNGKRKQISLNFIALHLRDKLDALNKEFLLVSFDLCSTQSEIGEKVRLGQIEAMLGLGPYLSRYDYSSNVSNDNNNGVSREWKPQPIIKNPNGLPILICCSLNGKSHDTMLYDAKNDKLIKNYGYECYRKLTNNDYDNNGLSFMSMYKHAIRNNNNSEPNYTTWKTRYPTKKENDKNSTVKDTVDYIFSKGERWNVTHYLDIPQTLNNNNNNNNTNGNGNDSMPIKSAMPDWNYPSDHFSLVMRMEWKD